MFEGTDDVAVTQCGLARYELLKPGDVNRRPPWVASYHYRLDWQLWFAAMSDYEKNPWLVHLCYKMLRGQPSALSLLSHNPFPDKPPTYLRAQLYEYEFTQGRRKTARGGNARVWACIWDRLQQMTPN